MTLMRRKFLLLALSCLWLVLFPAKGAVFQGCLYLLPLLVVVYRDTRELLWEHARYFVVLGGCFALPLLVSELRAAVFWGYPFGDGAFEAFWRLAVFPLVLVTVCRYCRCTSRQILIALVGVGIFYGLAGLGGVFFDTVPVLRSFGARAAGFVSNPNPYGFLMAVTCLVALFLVMTARHDRELVFAVVGGGVGFAGLLVSGSRSALLAWSVALVVMAILGWRYFHVSSLSRRTIVCGGVVVLLLAGILVALPSSYVDLIHHRMAHVAQGDIRLTIWSRYLECFVEHPVLGVPIRCGDKIQINGQGFGPHNMYLSVLVQSGILGAGALISGLLWLIRKATLNRPSRTVVVPMALLLCFYCFFNSSFFGNEMTQGVFALIVVLSLHSLDELSA